MERLTDRANAGTLTNFCLYELDAIDLGRQYDKPVPVHNEATRKGYRNCCTEMFKGEAKWFGGIQSVAEGKAIFKQGWPEGANHLKVLAERLAWKIPPAKSVRRKLCWADDGDEVSKDRLNGGQVDSCWRTTRRELSQGPEVVTIETNWGGDWNVTADQLFWQGAAAACMTDLLESAGYRVEVYVTDCARQKDGRLMTVRVRIKEPDQPARLDTMAAVMCHAGIYRIFGMAALEQATFKIDDSHGHTVKLTRGQFEALEATLGQSGVGSICFGGIYDEQSAVRAIEQEIARLQGENQ
jgi:hypothetical protein